MVEERKLNFKGKRGTRINFNTTLVGKVIDIQKEYITIDGYEIKNRSRKKIQLSSEKNDNICGFYDIKNLNHIKLNDILSINNTSIRSLFRDNSNSNFIFATVRCNSNCLMCSQPPLDYDDTIENIEIWDIAIDLMPNNIRNIGITGGEPTLLGSGLVKIINKLLCKYDDIKINILSNGRLQAKSENISLLSKITKPKSVVFAIPLYSDIYSKHDYIVQAKDAFYQTCLGIHNLASLGFLIEIRIVLHKLSLERLPNLARFIHFNFPFTYHITFMGLEIIGYTKANKEELIVTDQEIFVDILKESLVFLNKWEYNVSIYNTPFCHLPETLWKFAKQSISEWKNSFHKKCDDCDLKKNCAGFFSWNIKHTKAYPISLNEN